MQGTKRRPSHAPPARHTAEHGRLEEARARRAPWRAFGPYLAERAWGTVREDYSSSGDAWGHFTHDDARSRAYRWNEDGLAGISDKNGLLCLSLALWNEEDPILKERLFGLTGPEGNHGEDVKELYFYEDATPTASYLRYLYKYPQRRFPYEALREESRARSVRERELEIEDAGAFAEGRYFDVTVEYAKASPEDVALRITVDNRGPEAAPLHVLPQLLFRNTWSWSDPPGEMPEIRAEPFRAGSGFRASRAEHPELGVFRFYVEEEAELLFTNNDTNAERLYGEERARNRSPWVKDAFHAAVVHGAKGRTNPELRGSKLGAWRRLVVPPGGRAVVRARLCREAQGRPFEDEDELFELRRREADDFYASIGPELEAEGQGERKRVCRQAAAGLFWTMQFYHYDVERWLEGDALPPPESRRRGRNWDWRHVSVADVVSMPDCWEYPWFAAWDLAFHAVALASFDVDQAKQQLKLMVKEWYQHPNGQLPAYEWEFSDLNPPVHAWATFQVYKIERRVRGKGDRNFLERVFHKLLINFAWWVNRRDVEGNNVFEGGFLGLDNVSLFDRSEALPPGFRLEQADATAWMAMYSLDMMRIAQELALENHAYEDLASKFFEHFLRIAHALHHPVGEADLAPWSESDGFYFDILREHGRPRHLPVRSLVGLVPLFAVHVITPEVFGKLENFRRRYDWFLGRHPHLAEAITERPDGRRVLAATGPGRLERVLGHLFDDAEFMSPFGPRSLSKEHAKKPVVLAMDGRRFEIGYEPGESLSRMKGGNSNWRGPVWIPTSYLLYRSLQRLDHGYGGSVRIPRKDGSSLSLAEGASEIASRIIRLFERDASGRVPYRGGRDLFDFDPHFREKHLFYEYFHGETGEGLGASHQTGWTSLVADLILRESRRARGGT